jgi:hypothetical protein
MYIAEVESNRKRRDDNSESQSNTDRAARQLAEKFAITIAHAHVIILLAGLGEQEAQR